MYQSLKREWDKKPPNLERCGEILTKLKVFSDYQIVNIVRIHVLLKTEILAVPFKIALSTSPK